MNEKAKTWLMAMGVAAALAFAVFICYAQPDLLRQLSLEGSDLGGGAVAALIVWLALRGRTPLSQRTRLVMGIGVGATLLLGFAVYFMS